MEDNPEAMRPEARGDSLPHLAGAPTPAGEEASANEPRGASRRKWLMRGLIGGPVALAAMRPVKTLASSSYCTASGWQSFKKNASTSAKPKKGCTSGHSITHYQNTNNCPSPCRNYQGTNITCHYTGSSQTQFHSLFGGSDTNTLVHYLGSSSSNQATFICSVFNATSVSGYPFTVSQIYAIWSNPALLSPGTTMANAVLFFKQLNID